MPCKTILGVDALCMLEAIITQICNCNETEDKITKVLLKKSKKVRHDCSQSSCYIGWFKMK